jgi:hypothetical protein
MKKRTVSLPITTATFIAEALHNARVQVRTLGSSTDEINESVLDGIGAAKHLLEQAMKEKV